MATYNDKHGDAYRSEGWKPFNWEKGGPQKMGYSKGTDAPKVGKIKDVTNRDTTCKGKY